MNFRDELTETKIPNFKGLPKETKIKVTATLVYPNEPKGKVYDEFTTTVKLLKQRLKSEQDGTIGTLSFEFEVVKG